MEYNLSGLRKAAAPQGAAAFNFSGLRRADDQQQDDQQPSTADIFAIGNASKKVTPPQPERFNVMDEARRASQVLRNIGRRMVSPVKRIGEGVADVMTGGGIYPQRAMAGAVPQPRTADGDLVAEGLKKMATGAADVGITATMPGTTLAGEAIANAFDLPEISPAEAASTGIAEGIKHAKQAALMFGNGEGMKTPLPGGGMAPTGAMLRLGRGAVEGGMGVLTAKEPFMNLLTKLGPLVESVPAARYAMAPVSESGVLKPTLEQKRFQTPEEKDAEVIADLLVPMVLTEGPKMLRGSMRQKIADARAVAEEAKQMRKDQPPAAADAAPVPPDQPEVPPVMTAEEKPAAPETAPPAEPTPVATKQPAAKTPPLNFDGLRRADEPAKPKQPMPADPVSTMPVPPPEDKVVLPNADRAARRTLTRADYAKADAGEFPVLSAIGKDRITPDLVPDRRTGKMVERGEYADTPNVFKAGKGESGISLASAVERYNEMLPEEAHITDTEFLERLNDETARFEKRHRVQAKMADAVIPKSKYIDLNRLGEEDRAQLLDTVEGIVPYMQVKYADLDDGAALKAMKDIRAGKTGARAAQLLLHEASDAIAMDGLGISHEGQDAFIPLEDLRRMGVDAREEAKNPQPKKRSVEDEAAAFAVMGLAPFLVSTGNDDVDKVLKVLGASSVAGALATLNSLKTRKDLNYQQKLQVEYLQERLKKGDTKQFDLQKKQAATEKAAAERARIEQELAELKERRAQVKREMEFSGSEIAKKELTGIDTQIAGAETRLGKYVSSLFDEGAAKDQGDLFGAGAAAGAVLGAGAIAQQLTKDDDNKWKAGAGLVAMAALGAPGRKGKAIEPEGKNLVAIHNISGDKLLFADKLGGLALPSIAITKHDANFEGFGDISLVGKPDLIDPKRAGNKVVDADMYSPRYPDARYDVSEKNLKSVAQKLRENWLEHYSADDLPGHKRNHILNKKPEWWAADYDSYASAIADGLKDDGYRSLRYDDVAAALFLKEIGEELPKTSDGIREAMTGKDDAYNEWLQDTFEPAMTKMKFFNGFTDMGKRRYKDFTLDNVVRDMKSRMKEGEGFSYGAGNVRAAAAKKFKSIAEIQKNRNRIVTPEEMEGIKKEMNDKLIELAEQYKPDYQYDSKRFGYYDEFAGALNEGLKTEMRKAMTDYGFNIQDWQPIYDYLDKLRNTPTEYFEAKPQRAVSLGEFAGAVVPADASAKVRQALDKHGITEIEEYDPKVKTSRKEALQRLVTRIPDALFATAGAGLLAAGAAAASGDDDNVKKIGGMMTAMAAAAAAGVGIAGAQLLLGKDDDKEKAGTALAGIAMMGAVGRMNPKTRDTFNAMQRHVQGRFALGEIRSGELGTALRDVVKEYLEKGDGRFIPKDERALLLQASGSWNAKQQAREAGKNFKLQNEIMRFARSIEPTFSDLTDSAGEATSSKRSIVEAGWVTRGIWENIKDRVTDEINNNRQYAHLGAEGKRELFRTVEKNYEYLIERSNEAIWNGQLGMGGADRAAAIAPDTYTGYEDLSRLRVNMSDADRNFEAFFGKDYERAKKAFLDPLDKSKEAHADLQKRYLDDLTDKVVKKFGIRRYSRADAAVQNYGEGYRSVEAEIPLEVLTVNRDEVLSRAAGPDGAPKKFIPSGDYKENTAAIKAEKLKAWVKEQYGEGAEPGELTGGRKMQVKVPYTEADLVREFGKPRAEEIKAAEAWFRKSYDDLLAKVNMVRAKIYPGNPDKIIRRRRDYFRHYQEIADQLGGLLNIFESPGLGLIDSRLSGISAETAPKSKWASFMQRRSGTRTTESAIGGFLNYLPNASYAINIDPHISRLRGLRETIAEGTEKTKNANNFVEWLHDYANNLSGKTSDADRALMKLIGRGNMRALNSLNSRVKSNTVLGNISSALMQLGNVPQGIASAKMHSIPGLVDTFVDLLNGSPNSSKSGFIKTRYEGNMYEPFDVRIMDQPKKFAKFMLEALDQVGTRFIWNSHYRKAIAEGMQEAEAIRWADNKTRRMVGGRGIGEVPILQGSKVMQLIAPFQLEVGNLLWNVRDFAQQKDYTALVTLAAATYLFNQAKEKTVGGDGVLLDPIQALIDAVHIIAEEDDKTKGAMKGTGRMVGELLSNMPFGQTAADVYPEYGAQDIFGTGFDLPTRKEFFGRTDPNRFGGGLLSIKALSDPLFKVLPPWGGGQAKKTKAAIDAIRQHGVYNRAGEYQYDVDNEKTRALMFGPNGTNAAREYHDNK